MDRVEFLIIGQGLAGTAISWQLHQQGRSFKVLDQFQPDSPSRVAAGLINPVTGRNLNPTWKIDELLPVAMNQYIAMDKFLDIHSLHEMPVWRFFQKEREQEKFTEQIEQTPKWLSRIPAKSNLKDLRIEADGCVIHGGGWLDTEPLLDKWRTYLQSNNVIIEHEVDWRNLEIDKSTVKYESIIADHLIICTGFLPPNHRFFPELPFSQTKGEILTVTGPDWPPDKVYMYQYFLVPLGYGKWRLGATYNWNELNNKRTQEAAAVMLKRWGEAFGGAFTVIDHRAGVRPSTTDRMPLVGTHHAFPNVHLLSGLGSKGAVFAPWLSAYLLEAIEKGEDVLPEIRLDRKKKAHN